MSDTQNYVVGRGRLYFNRFPDSETYVGDGERYLGNTPALSMAANATTLDHYSSESGLKEKDKSVTLQRDLTGSFTCDNINPDNVALWFAGTNTAETQASSAGARFLESFEVQKGLWYQIGVTDGVPIGLSNLTIIRAVEGVATAATGTLTFSGTGTADDTITINGQAITLKASAVGTYEVTIGGTAAATAQAVKAKINAYPDIFEVSASGDAAVLTLTAHVPGTGGNSITTTESGTGTAFGGATLSGGTGTVTELVVDTDWEYDEATGRFHILSGASNVADGDTVTISYEKTAAVTAVVVTGGTEAYGELRFVADNAVGANTDYFWPYVKMTANGEYALKGDEWQVMSFSFEALKLPTRERVYARQR